MRRPRAALDAYADKVREKLGIEPELVIREGKPAEEIHKLIEEDQDIAILVLAAGAARKGRDRWSPRSPARARPSRFR